jgi:hypothetical protein
MNRPVSFDAILTTKRKYANRSVALWAVAVVLVAVACTVLVLDAAMTPEQRIALFAQSGLFP